jgi:hypothetical protein
MPNDPNIEALKDVPVLSSLVIPKVTIASLAVYSVMGGLGYGLTHAPKAKNLGSGLIIAAFVGMGYAISHAIVLNIAPETAANLGPNGQGP